MLDFIGKRISIYSWHDELKKRAALLEAKEKQLEEKEKEKEKRKEKPKVDE